MIIFQLASKASDVSDTAAWHQWTIPHLGHLLFVKFWDCARWNQYHVENRKTGAPVDRHYFV